MLRKSLSFGASILKVSTWISGIGAILVVLVVAFFVGFPKYIKAPLEGQLTDLLGMEVEFANVRVGISLDGLILKLDDIEISQAQQVILAVDSLHWQLDFLRLFEDLANPDSDVEIETLTIYTSTFLDYGFDFADFRQQVLEFPPQVFEMFKSIKIAKTIIKNSRDFIINPIILEANSQQLSIKITKQNLNFDGTPNDFGADISATFAIKQQPILNMPIELRGADFGLIGSLELSQKNGDEMLEFTSALQNMELENISNYLPQDLLDKDLLAWIKQAFVSGSMTSANLTISKNLSQKTPTNTTFSGHFAEANLHFDDTWSTLKNLDADLKIDGKKLKVAVNSAKLDNLDLHDFKVEVADLAQVNLKISGEIFDNSEALIDFVKAQKFYEVNEVFTNLKLQGEASAKVDLEIYLDGKKPQIFVEASLENNQISLVDSEFEVVAVDAKVIYEDAKIRAKGSGNIRGEEFEIEINPQKTDNSDALLSLEMMSKTADLRLQISQKLNKSWHTKIISDDIKGDIWVFLEAGKLPIVRLSDFKIKTLETLKGAWQITAKDIPSMDLSGSSIEVDDYLTPDFKVNLINENQVLIINNLQFKGVAVSKQDLRFNGVWLSGKTSLVASAKGQQLSEFLSKMNIKEPVIGGEFDFDIRLFCECSPWNMGPKNLSGFVSMEVKKGVFTDKDPNFGRLLSLLNIRSIAKRLKLNVADITTKGFSYDDILTQVYIGQSKATIDKFELRASSGKISLTGDSNLDNKTYNLAAKVRPAIADSVPIATYLAGGGLAGLGIWIADKVLFDGKAIGQIVDTVAEFEYKIGGTWDKPIIK